MGGVAAAEPNRCSSCYSPTQKLELAYTEGAQGCACDEANDNPVCVHGVALICAEGGIWQAVEDGPCYPPPPHAYSPEACGATGGIVVPNPGAVCESGEAFGEIEVDASLPTEGGLCCKPLSKPVYTPESCRGVGGVVEPYPGPVCVGGELLGNIEHVAGEVEGSVCCKPGPPLYTPDSCEAAGGVAVPSPGTAQIPERDCATGVALGAIDGIASGWDEGGLCCAKPKACGARAGDTCDADEYCAYEEGQLCGQADAEALCKPRPESCSLVKSLYAPVCGCDGVTYYNSCVAAEARTGIYAFGACLQPN